MAPAAAQAPSPTAPPSLAEQRFPAGAGYPDWMIGRTVQDVANLSQQMASALRQPNTAPAPVYAPAPPPPPSAPSVALPTNDDYLTRPAEATAQALQYYRERDFAPVMRQQVESAAQTNRSLMELRDPDAFRKWGPEIDLTLRQYAPDVALHTPDNIKAVVEMVRGRHAHEVAEDEIEKRVQERLNSQLGGTLRPGAAATATSANVPGQLDLDKLPPNYGAALKRLNLQQSDIDDFLIKAKCTPFGMTLEQARDEWTKQAQRGDIITDGREFVSVLP